jgi:hypothetical protein
MNRRAKDTRTDLADELERLALLHDGARESQLRALAEAARAGTFHDYKSEHAMPKVVLVGRLIDAGLSVLADRVIGGEFDEVADPEDEAAMALELQNDPELRALLKLPTPGRS